MRRHATAAVTALLALIAVWNVALMGAAQSGAVRIGETLSFDRAWASQARVVHGWFGNPFTYPASLVFALRNGVSPGDYDLLSTNRFLADPLQPYGRVDVGSTDDRGGDEWLLGDGWHAPEKDGAATFRWAASPATLRIPLDHAATLRVQVRLHAFAYPGAPPQTLTLARRTGRLQAAARAAGHARLADGRVHARPDGVAGGGQRSWNCGSRMRSVRWTSAPAATSRPLAAAVDWVRVSVSSSQ